MGFSNYRWIVGGKFSGILAGGVSAFILNACGPDPVPEKKPKPDPKWESVPLRINAGDGSMEGWVSDRDFSKGGEKFKFNGTHRTDGVEDPAPAKIYESVRHREHSYRIPLAKGTYRLRFHFTDGAGNWDRLMNFEVEGTLVIEGYTPVVAGGGMYRASVVEVVAEVVDGRLDIDCREGSKGNDVLVAGIEILPADPESPPTTEPVAWKKPVPFGDTERTTVTVSKELEALAGGPVRLVWLRGLKAPHYTTAESAVRLMAFDTADGKGERELVAIERPYSKPLITDDGKGVVFSDRKENTVHFVPFAGGEIRKLRKGFASDVWRDPGTGIDWVYARSAGGGQGDPIIRFPVGDPGVVEGVWDRTANGHRGMPWMQLSADGRRFADAFPWSKCGVGLLAKPGHTAQNWEPYGDGCWPGMAPDSSYRFYHFNGSHTDLTFYDSGNDAGRTVWINDMPGMKGGKVYYPRWSNHPRLITVAGPELSPECQLYVGKFNPEFTWIEGWVQVTGGDKADIFGDVWVDFEHRAAPPNSTPSPPQPGGLGPDPKWPGDLNGVAFLWESLKEKNEIPVGDKFATCNLRLRGKARPGFGHVLDLRGGWAEADAARGAFLSSQCQETNAFSLEAMLTPAANDKGENARIVSFSDDGPDDFFSLVQHRESLVFNLRTAGNEEATGFGKLRAGIPHHVLVSFGENRLTIYLEGEPVFENEFVGNLSNWSPAQLVFGAGAGGASGWDGSLEAVALRSRPVGAAEAATLADQSRARLSGRKVPARAAVKAILLEKTATPTKEEMGTYRRALVENVYKVKNVIEGEVPERVVVAEWAVFDGTPVAEKKEIGKSYQLELEPFADHLELKGEFKSADHLELDTPRFYQVD